MGKRGSKPMDWEAARRIQSAIDSGRAVKADEGFKSRAMSAAARNSKSTKEKFEDWVIEQIMLASEEGTEVDDIFNIGNWF